MISTWSTTTLAFRRNFRSLSCCDFDGLDPGTTEEAPLPLSSADVCTGLGSCNSYWIVTACVKLCAAKIEGIQITYLAVDNTALLIDLEFVIVVHSEPLEEDLVLV
jgi:hypothetical protein